MIDFIDSIDLNVSHEHVETELRRAAEYFSSVAAAGRSDRGCLVCGETNCQMEGYQLAGYDYDLCSSTAASSELITDVAVFWEVPTDVALVYLAHIGRMLKSYDELKDPHISMVFKRLSRTAYDAGFGHGFGEGFKEAEAPKRAGAAPRKRRTKK